MPIQDIIDQGPSLPDKASQNVDDFIQAVIMRESSGNPKAVSPVGARGLMQIMPVVLQEYNNFNKTRFGPNDLFNPDINKQIGTWYLYQRIPQMLDHYGLEVSPENILKAYNMGIGNLRKGRNPTETQNYVRNIMGDFNK